MNLVSILIHLVVLLVIVGIVIYALGVIGIVIPLSIMGLGYIYHNTDKK